MLKGNHQKVYNSVYNYIEIFTYGENQVNPNNTKETQPLWYKEKFNELLMLLDFKLVEAL